jgi:hypothetical protein
MRTIDLLGSRPGMRVPSARLEDIATYLDGYLHALAEYGVHSGYAWREYVACTCGISSNAWSWHRSLRHFYGSESAAIAALPALFDAYVIELGRVGANGIVERWQDQFGGAEAIPVDGG